MKYFFTILLLSLFITASAQKKPTLVKNPLKDIPLSQIKSNKALFNNPDYAVYQDNTKRILFYPENESFQYENSFLAYDKKNIFYEGKKILSNKKVEIIEQNAQHFYWKTKEGVYYFGKKIEYADAKSFQKIDEFYYKDKKSVFFKGTKITDASPKKFHRISPKNAYYTDGKSVFYEGKKLNGADPASFKVEITYAYDKNNFYGGSQKISYQNETFSAVNPSIFKSKNIVFTFRKNKLQKVLTMDAATLSPIEGHFSKDKNGIYYGEDRIIPSKEIKNLEIKGDFLKNDGKLYLKEKRLFVKLDFPTLKMLNSHFLMDKNGIYTIQSGKNLKKLPLYYSFPMEREVVSVCENLEAGLMYNHQFYCNGVYAPDLSETQTQKIKEGKLFVGVDNGATIVGESKNDIFITYKDKEKNIFKNKSNSKNPISFIGYRGYIFDKNRAYLLDNKRIAPMPYIDRASAQVVDVFLKDAKYVYFGEYQLIKNENVEFIASFQGIHSKNNKRVNSDFYLLKNKEGYWLTEVFSDGKASLCELGDQLPDNLKKWLEKNTLPQK